MESKIGGVLLHRVRAAGDHLRPPAVIVLPTHRVLAIAWC